MKIVIELIKARMRDDHHSAFPQQRFVPVHVEVIAERHHLNEQRIQRRVDVIRRDVRNARDQDVALSFYRYLVLSIVQLQDLVVHRFGLARVASDQARTEPEWRGAFFVWHLAASLKRSGSSLPTSSVHERELVLVPRQNVVAVGEHLVIESRLDVEHLALLVDELAEPDDLVIQLRRRRVHVRMRIADRLRLVMRTQAIRNRTDRPRPIYARRPSGRG